MSPMIRRDDRGDFLLIAQHDHALVAGVLAEHFGNGNFAVPEPRDKTIKGVSLHDCGWPLHDDEPTLNKEGSPSDVFETTRPVALKVWTASAERASADDPYAGLLTSLHVLSLSVFATSETSIAHEKFDLDDPQERFANLKFQQREIARQEELRARCGLRTEKPLHHSGLPKEGMQRAEDQLQFNFRMLQAMDFLSLAACCTKPPADQTQDVMPRPGAKPIKLAVARRGDDVVTVDPWPFDQAQVELKIPVCRIPARRYASNDELRATVRGGGSEVLTCVVTPTAPASATTT